ncbi:hypothetical protein DIR67_23575 [Salmonella enterica subsp. enterica serovar Newport]|nr:hypothetical protein [Salmonella enterica subsp. enterica serovar Newport]
MEKRQRRILFQPFLIRPLSLYLVIRKPVTPAAAERQERSDLVSEEASFHLPAHSVVDAPELHITLPHEALS